MSEDGTAACFLFSFSFFLLKNSATKFDVGVVPLRLLRPALYAGKLVGIMFLSLRLLCPRATYDLRRVKKVTVILSVPKRKLGN